MLERSFEGKVEDECMKIILYKKSAVYIKANYFTHAKIIFV
jgi:hypothetical protein